MDSEGILDLYRTLISKYLGVLHREDSFLREHIDLTRDAREAARAILPSLNTILRARPDLEDVLKRQLGDLVYYGSKDNEVAVAEIIQRNATHYRTHGSLEDPPVPRDEQDDYGGYTWTLRKRWEREFERALADADHAVDEGTQPPSLTPKESERRGSLSPSDLSQPVSGEPNELQTRHSPDFRSVLWFGTSYSFTATQAACVKALWEAWAGGTPELGEQTILVAAEADSKRLQDLFRKHAAWNAMIQPGSTKGSYRLVEPD